MYQIEMWSAHYEIPFVGLIFRKIAVNKMYNWRCRNSTRKYGDRRVLKGLTISERPLAQLPERLLF